MQHSTRHSSREPSAIALDGKIDISGRSYIIPASTEDSRSETYLDNIIEPRALDVHHGIATESDIPSNIVQPKVKETEKFGRRESGVFGGYLRAARPSLLRSHSEKEVVPVVRAPSLAPGANTPESAEAQTFVSLLHQEAEVKAAALERSSRLGGLENYAQALEAGKALVVSRIGTAPSLRKSTFQEALEEGRPTDEDDVARSGLKTTQSFAHLQDFSELQTSRTQPTARLDISSDPASPSVAPEHSISHRRRAAAEVGGSATDALLEHEQDVPNPKRMRIDTPPAKSVETGRSADHHAPSPPEAVSQPAQRPTPRTIRVQLCVKNHRGAFVEWPHGMISTHTVQTLFEKFADCSRLRHEPDHINFFLADAKRKREYGIAKGDEVMFEDLKEKIGIIAREERHMSSFQVHMEAEVKVESDDEVVLEM